MSDSPLDVVLHYHDRTKHRFDGYAKGPETLDWDDQPNPFRHYEGAELVELPLVADELKVAFAALSGDEAIPAQPLSLTSIAMLLEMSLALSAWKQYGTARWSLRVNPSSGNLHPTETWLVVLGVPDLADGLYHYRADVHGLELRCQYPPDLLIDAKPGVYLGFSSVHWREAWKYGERAFRYCNHDVGHAIACVSYATAAMGWGIASEIQIGDDALAALFGLDREGDFGRAEREHPDILLAIVPEKPCQDHGFKPEISAHQWQTLPQQGQWFGAANVLDKKHLYQWPVIDEVAEACLRPAASPSQEGALTSFPAMLSGEPPLPCRSEDTASKLFRRRRSAQAFDGATIMPQSDFIRCLQQLYPSLNPALAQAVPWMPRLHPILFVHRVEDVAPGLYVLPRTEQGATLLRANLRQEFQWQQAELPVQLPLYQLILAKAERTIAKLSCQQPIAGESSFSLGMLAEFDATVTAEPWRYRELFWEAGAIGQVLYLEAEAAGLRGTGIGCYFDDPVHELLGITTKSLQSMYHFTVGGPLVDHRITTLPPYR